MILTYGIIFFCASIFQSNAGYLSFNEGDVRDIKRVSNNLIYFCHDNKDILEELSKNSGSLQEDQIEKLKKEPLIKDFIKDPNLFISDLKAFKFLLEQKNDFLNNTLDVKTLKDTSNSIMWISYILERYRIKG